MAQIINNQSSGDDRYQKIELFSLGMTHIQLYIVVDKKLKNRNSNMIGLILNFNRKQEISFLTIEAISQNFFLSKHTVVY